MTEPGVRYKYYTKDQATKSPTLGPGYISKHFTMEWGLTLIYFATSYQKKWDITKVTFQETPMFSINKF